MNKKLYTVGDIHSSNSAELEKIFRAVRLDGAKIILLGDLVDRGTELKTVMQMISENRDIIEGITVGNHDHKIYRHYMGNRVNLGRAASMTVKEMDEDSDTKERFISMIEEYGYLWMRHENHLFVHGAIRSFFYDEEPIKYVDFMSRKIERQHTEYECVFYGFTDGQHDDSGKPVRDMQWLTEVKSGWTVWKGHDVLSTFTEINHVNDNGGRVVFMDTGGGFIYGKLTAKEVI